MKASDITLCIDPFSYHFENDKLFGSSVAAMQGENIMAPWVYLANWFKDRGVRVHTADRLLRREVGGKMNVVMSFGMRKRYKQLAAREDVVLSAFFAFESPVVEPALYSTLHDTQDYFKRVYSFSDYDSLAPLLKRPMKLEHFCLPFPADGIRDDLWRNEDRKFLVVINHNRVPTLAWRELYTERLRAIEFFAATRDIDLYGRGWDGAPFQPSIGWMPGTAQHMVRFLQKQWQRAFPLPYLPAARTAYKGSVPSKLKTLGEYRFSLVFDNVILNGWITEKIFDCFIAGCVPVYWGAPDVERYIPEGCFIDMRQFKNYEELRRFLKAVTASDLRAYKEAARDYLRSPRFRPFTKRAFAELLGRIVEEDTGVRLAVAA